MDFVQQSYFSPRTISFTSLFRLSSLCFLSAFISGVVSIQLAWFLASELKLRNIAYVLSLETSTLNKFVRLLWRLAPFLTGKNRLVVYRKTVLLSRIVPSPTWLHEKTSNFCWSTKKWGSKSKSRGSGEGLRSQAQKCCPSGKRQWCTPPWGLSSTPTPLYSWNHLNTKMPLK